MKNELIKISTKRIDGEEINCVSARELHEFLEIETRFDTWFGRMICYGFEENSDYRKIVNKVHAQKRARTYEEADYIITLDMAKEISMIQRTPKGKQARQYFIQCEKKLKEVVKTPKLTPQEQLALQLFNGGIDAISAHKELLAIETKELNDKIEEQKPKVEYTDNVLQAEGLLTVTVIAKDFGLSAKKLNQILVEQGIQFRQGKQWLLYAKYQDKGYTQSTTDKEGHVNTKWTQKGKKFIVELLLKLGYKLNKDITNGKDSTIQVPPNPLLCNHLCREGLRQIVHTFR